MDGVGLLNRPELDEDMLEHNFSKLFVNWVNGNEEEPEYKQRKEEIGAYSYLAKQLAAEHENKYRPFDVNDRRYYNYSSSYFIERENPDVKMFGYVEFDINSKTLDKDLNIKKNPERKYYVIL